MKHPSMPGLTKMTSTASESFLMNVREESNCILAEIVRLAGFVPPDFLDPSSSKYKLLILDFNYFTRTAHYEKIIEENEGTNDFGKLYVDRSTLIKWIFICLVFKPSTLKNDAIKMRQIVEDFFRDEWVIQLGLGLNVNLLDYWQSYRAALTAITNQVDINKAKSMATYHYNALSKLSIPQKASTYVQAIDIYSQFDAQALVLLLRASNFEMDFFTKTLEELDLEDKKNGDSVIQVKRRIAQVDEMYDLSGNLALAQHLQKLGTQLDCLSALYNVREEDERQAQRYADPSYLWPILGKIVVAREMADFDDNFRLAESTYTISNLSLGVSRMALKKVGMISINPKELLEEGIRRELAVELPSLLTMLDKNTSLEGGELYGKLEPSDLISDFRRP
ncbi:hypothetical protein TELCIR_08291 [Teladorsagia circumcincta]|uniref:Uncharacterized protein n=1 Tax=Teladorsagia circumcincta TaxID=45464 RepID=A0A2G9UIA1_TELCI|nr:hypothetical protein TELCIR_08291 [Teladorsagia circumcincta]